MSEMNQTVYKIIFPETLDSINSKVYMKQYLEELEEIPEEASVIGDLEKTKLLSSSGLRLILTMAKRRKAFRLINADPEVYRIMDMTGLTNMMSVERQIPKIDPIEGEPIARGSNGQVYAIEKDIIVKMFSEKTTEDEIHEEWKNAKIAVMLGVPSALCYSMVTDGTRLGIMFERMETAGLASLVYEDYENFDSYAKQFAELFQELHSIHDTKHEFHKVKDDLLEITDHADYLSKEDIEKMRAFLDAVPERDSIVHGDFHPNNIGAVFGELILLDMAEIGYGNPVFDFIASYYDLILSGETIGKEHPEITKKYFGLSVEELKKLWDILVESYFPGITAEKKQFFNETINWMLGFKLLIFPVLHPNHPKEKHEAWLSLARERFIDHYDEVMSRIAEIDKMIEDSLMEKDG
ncbi:MAG: phosphotransferase [Lachnospiraceae bacterium]|nr:phosphotransferase [Lachnospiraceae bacterium]